MTIHFASARNAAANPLARVLTRRSSLCAANDNAPRAGQQALAAALRHFAEHGMGAAREARSRAEAAFFADDRQSYQHWLEICRILDRRMASSLTRSTAHHDA